MASYRPHYRVTVYAPRSVDATEATILTPAAGALHSDAFKITTHPSLSGWKPYLQSVSGRRGRLDLLTGRTDTGEFQFQVLDVRTTAGGSNLERWFSQFHGNADDRPQWLGCKFFCEESLDDGVTWSAFATGRIRSVELDGRIPFRITGRDLADDLKHRVYVGRPHSSITYAHLACLFPPGFLDDLGTYADFTAWTGPVVGECSGPGGGVISTILFGIKDSDGADQTVNKRALGAGLKEVLEGIQPRWIETIRVGALWDRPPLLGGRVIREEQLVQLTEYDVLNEGAKGAVRCRVKHTSGASSGSTGTYLLRSVVLAEFTPRVGHPPVPVVYLIRIGALFDANGALWTGHPEYLAAPAAGVSVEVSIQRDARPTENAPLFIDDVLPGAHMRDLVDGKFSTLNPSTGAVQFAVPLDTTTADAGHGRGAVKLATLATDATFPLFRRPVVAESRLDEALERNFGPLGLSYRLTPDGKLLGLDLRMPTDLTGLLTIGNADLVENQAPRWHHGTEKALRDIQVRTYREMVPKGYGQAPIFERAIDALFPVDDFAGVDRGDQPYEIVVPGLRSGWPPEFINGQSRREWVDRWAQKLVQPLRWAFGAGPQEVALPCRRTSNTSGCYPGDLRLVNVDELPNPQTNLRGGTRVMRCVSREEEGLTVWLGFVDLGINANADAPTVGAPAQEAGNTKHGISGVITRNAASDPVVVEFAITDTSTGARPAETSALWTFGIRTTAGGTVYCRFLPSNSRIWIRARSEPAASDLPAMPSAWAFPSSGTGYVDTAALTAPSACVVGSIEGKRATGSWTNGETLYGIEALLNGTRLALLPPVGTLGPPTQYRIGGLTVSTTYNAPGFAARHYDAYGGVSASSTDDFTTTGTPGTAPNASAPLYAVMGTTSPIRTPTSRPTAPDVGVFGIRVGCRAPADTLDLRREFQMAPDSGGSPGTWAAAGILGEGQLEFTAIVPLGVAYHFRYRLTHPDLTPGGWSASLGPLYGVPLETFDASVADASQRRDDPFHDSGFALRAADILGKEAFDDLYVPSAKLVKVGTVASPGTITKTLRLPVHLAMAFDDTLPVQCGLVYVHPRTANFLVDFLLPIFLAPGVTITAVRMRGYRQTSSDNADFAFHRVESDGNTSLASVTHSTTGWATLSASINESVTSGRHYVFHVVLYGLTAAADGRGQWVEVEYTTPDYAKAV